MVLFYDDLSLDFIDFFKKHLLDFGINRLLKHRIGLSIFLFQVHKLLVTVYEIWRVLGV